MVQRCAVAGGDAGYWRNHRYGTLQTSRRNCHDSQGVMRRGVVCIGKRRACGYRLSDWLYEMRQGRRDMHVHRHPVGGVRQIGHVCIRDSDRTAHLLRFVVSGDQRGHPAVLLVRRAGLGGAEARATRRRSLPSSMAPRPQAPPSTPGRKLSLRRRRRLAVAGHGVAAALPERRASRPSARPHPARRPRPTPIPVERPRRRSFPSR